MKILKNCILAFIFNFSVMAVSPEDRDADGISDELESLLLQRFAPVFYLGSDKPDPDADLAEPREGIGVPVSMSWLLRNSALVMKATGGTGGRAVVLDRPDIARALLLCRALDGAKEIAFECYHITGNAPGDDKRTWIIARERNEGVYGRVWIPWRDFPHLYSIQYFMFLTWNETAYTGDVGNHEGDWLCVDFTVDTRSSFSDPPIIHAIYHNHGRQLFLTPEAIEFEDGHPLVFLERGTHEPWPNAGLRGKEGWPNNHGFATNVDFDRADLLPDWTSYIPFFLQIFEWLDGQVSENKIVREHNRGFRYAPENVPNIGEVVGSDVVSLCGLEGEFLLRFNGIYGVIGGFIEGSPSQGPVAQSNGKMWNRNWTRNGSATGPWTSDFAYDPVRSTNPFQEFSGMLFPKPSFSFEVPTIRPRVYVDGNAASQGDGSLTHPYKSVQLGVAMTASGGTVSVLPGSFDETFKVNQAVTIESYSGPVIIGE